MSLCFLILLKTVHQTHCYFLLKLSFGNISSPEHSMLTLSHSRTLCGCTIASLANILVTHTCGLQILVNKNCAACCRDHSLWVKGFVEYIPQRMTVESKLSTFVILVETGEDIARSASLGSYHFLPILIGTEGKWFLTPTLHCHCVLPNYGIFVIVVQLAEV